MSNALSQQTMSGIRGMLATSSPEFEILLNPVVGKVGANAVIVPDSNKRVDTLDVTDLLMNAVPQPVNVTFTIAAGASNVSTISIQLKDGGGTAIATTSLINVWLSDAATGIGLTATAPSGTMAAGASGTVINSALATGARVPAVAASKHIRAITDAAGLFILSLTATGKTAWYVAVGLPNGTVAVSRVLATGDYGA